LISLIVLATAESEHRVSISSIYAHLDIVLANGWYRKLHLIQSSTVRRRISLQTRSNKMQRHGEPLSMNLPFIGIIGTSRLAAPPLWDVFLLGPTASSSTQKVSNTLNKTKDGITRVGIQLQTRRM